MIPSYRSRLPRIELHQEGPTMFEPLEMGKFEFVRLSALRAAQLTRGCTARVPARHKRTTTAQSEVAAGKVCGLPRIPVTTATVPTAS